MKKLLTPFKLKNLTLKNHIILPPMATSKAGDNGEVSDEILAYYDEKTKNKDLALVIIEHSFIRHDGRANRDQMSVADDSMVEGLKALAHTLHHNDTLAVMQINHAGANANPKEHVPNLLAPSLNTHRNAHEMTKTEIYKLIEDFASAAKRVKDAGFDGVEIHAAHGYLLNQFYSPLTNKRTDEFGGDVPNRIRILIDVVLAVRQAVGMDFPILLRLGASDYQDGGTTLKDSIFAAKSLKEAGVDLLDISGGFSGYKNPDSDDQGYFHGLSEGIKKEVDIPTILTGGITNLSSADELISSGKTDLIGIGRPILNDSSWLKKQLEEENEKQK